MVHSGRERFLPPCQGHLGDRDGVMNLSLGALMHHHDDAPSLFLTSHARAMRKAPTRSEALLWAQLRGRKLGVRFRRQHPIDRYITDFCAICSKLVIEIDGAVHATPERQRYDEMRTAVLESYGYRVVRIAAGLVERDVLAAVEIVRATLHER